MEKAQNQPAGFSSPTTSSGVVALRVTSRADTMDGARYAVHGVHARVLHTTQATWRSTQSLRASDQAVWRALLHRQGATQPHSTTATQAPTPFPSLLGSGILKAFIAGPLAWMIFRAYMLV